MGLAIPQSTRIDMIEAKNTSLNLIKLLLNEYDNKQDKQIFVVPLYLNLDTEWDFPYTEAPISNRRKNNYIWVDDVTHPNDYGYFKMADTIYNTIKYAASLEE